MNQHILEEELHDFADGELGEEARARVSAHLETCASCQSELDELRSLAADLGGLPKAIDPPRDLWPAVSARIAERPSRSSSSRLYLLLALAAITLLALSWTVQIFRAPPPVETVAPRKIEKPTIALAAFDPSEAAYLEATRELIRTLEERKTKMRPETVAILEENLRVIDRAIENIRVALAADPASRDLTFMLASTYEMKLDVLRQATRIPLTM